LGDGKSLTEESGEAKTRSSLGNIGFWRKKPQVIKLSQSKYLEPIQVYVNDFFWMVALEFCQILCSKPTTIRLIIFSADL
jgi:hypothetical protein